MVTYHDNNNENYKRKWYDHHHNGLEETNLNSFPLDEIQKRKLIVKEKIDSNENNNNNNEHTTISKKTCKIAEKGANQQEKENKQKTMLFVFFQINHMLLINDNLAINW